MTDIDEIIKAARAERCWRSMTVEHVRAAGPDQPERFRASFASAKPVLRWFGYEQLDFSPGAIDLSRAKDGMPLLFGHDAMSASTLIGRAEEVAAAAEKIESSLRFFSDEDSQKVATKVREGHREMSFGYEVLGMERAGEYSGEPLYRVTRWAPFEASIVSVPADASVGVGRQFSPSAATPAAVPATPPNKEPRMQVETPAPAGRATPDITVIESKAIAAERQRASEIRALGKQWSMGDAAEKAVAEGLTLDAFRAQVLAAGPKPAALPTEPATQIGLTGKEARNYSLLRLMRAMAYPLESRLQEEAAFELECHRAVEGQFGASKNGGIFVPYEVQKRDLTVAGASGSQYLVGTDNRPESFIELLRNRTLLARLGAQMLDGLVGNVTIPRQSAAGTAYWLSTESTAITESQPTLQQVSMTPKTVGALYEASRLMTLQSSPAVERLINNDLSKVLAIAIDKAGFNGAGSSGEPTGVSATSGIGSVTGTSIAYAGMLEFQTDVATSNAMVNNCAYVTTPAVAALLAQRARFSNTDTPLWKGNILEAEDVVGFRGYSSNQLASASMIFGDWSQVLIGMWGVLELAVTNSHGTNFNTAIVTFRALQSVDVAVRVPGAFSQATSIT